MNLAKVQFSEEEFAIVQNADLLLTKNRVIGKVHQTFVGLSHQLIQLYHQKLNTYPIALTKCRPGITKGEQLKGLPWVVLDYPRYFDRENIMALRTIFWWGNDLTITLHLKGSYLQRGIKAIHRHRTLLEEKKFVICMSGDEWEHDLHTVHVNPLSEAISFESASFLKLSTSIALSSWNENLPEQLEEIHAVFANLIVD